MEDSPPDFITIRTPEAVKAVDIYELALELVESVHAVLEAANARFHLRDRLDRYATQIAMRLARTQAEARGARWKSYRDVIEHLTDVATMLDIVARQKATSAEPALVRARAISRQLIDELQTHALLGPAS